MDLRLVNSYKKSLIFLFGLGAVMGYSLKSSVMLSSYFMVGVMLVMSYPFSVGEKNGMDILYGTLPLSRKDIVTGRYLFVIAVEAVCAALTLLCSRLLALAIGTEYILADELFAMSLLTGVFFLVVALQYPLFFKFGYNKARIIALTPMIIIFLAVTQLRTLAELFGWNISLDGLLAFIEGSRFFMYAAPVLSGLVLLALSCLISRRIYEKREM